jgi:hypothetical protein
MKPFARFSVKDMKIKLEIFNLWHESLHAKQKKDVKEAEEEFF